MPEPELEILAALGPDPVQRVLIDGLSGAGKSTLADRLVAEWERRRGIRPQLVRLDDIYPGWDGLEAAHRQLRDDLLAPLADARPGSFVRWDWHADAAAERHVVDPARPLVVEGTGCLSRATRRLASFGVWVDLDEPTRRARALARDGDTYAPHWERWAAQERAFGDREHPHEIADLTIKGTDPTPTADPECRTFGLIPPVSASNAT